MTTISQLLTYPIKSTNGIAMDSIPISPLGLRFDRQWAVFDNEFNCLTGRDYPKLLDITAKVEGQKLGLHVDDQFVISVPVEPSTNSNPVKLFRYHAHGYSIHAEVDQWLSDYLGTPCQLLKKNHNVNRPVLTKHGGNEDTDFVAFADQAPVLILSKASLHDLNNRLDQGIGMERFRPNIVVDGCGPYDEDSWTTVKINDVTFKIIQQCERCIFTTIDVTTKKKDALGEPLRTLAKYRKGPKGGVVFGVHAVPLNAGTLRVGDRLSYDL